LAPRREVTRSGLLRVGSAVFMFFQPKCFRSTLIQRGNVVVLGGGGVLHSSLTGQFYPASTGMGRRLVRSFAAAVGWFQSCRLVQGWGVLQFKDESIMTGMVS